MTKGNINVSVENIFPLIKKFLYSDHEIFLRELISNATDATLKLKHLTNVGDAKVEYGNPQIEVKIDKDSKKLHIIDQGLGMTAEEVEKPHRQKNESLIRVELAGICNTDIELQKGYMDFEGVLGHEFVGTVVDSEKNER